MIIVSTMQLAQTIVCVKRRGRILVGTSLRRPNKRNILTNASPKNAKTNHKVGHSHLIYLKARHFRPTVCGNHTTHSQQTRKILHTATFLHAGYVNMYHWSYVYC